MQNLNVIGWIIISVYFMILIGLGSNLRKRASASMEDYFLTGDICMIGMYFTWYRYLPKEELAGPDGY